MVSAHQLTLLVLSMTPWTVSLTWSSNVNNLLSTRSINPEIEATTGLIETIEHGAQMALEHCQKVFKWDRWNCPKSAFSRNGKQPATRENAYARAIMAAAIVHSITSNCTRGGLKDCGCRTQSLHNKDENVDHPMIYMETIRDFPNNDWTLGDCSDNTVYAEKIVSLLLGISKEKEKETDVFGYINMHNDIVGKTIVRDSRQKRCRCRRVLGSCSVQICWMQMVPFEEVADLLRKRYNNARRVSYEKRYDGTIYLGNAAYQQRAMQQINLRELAFLDESPNYCIPNTSNGWAGTKGRMCSRDKKNTTSAIERRSCKTLCRSCGYRVKMNSRDVVRRCNCRFQWCCNVTCDICTERINEYFCR